MTGVDDRLSIVDLLDRLLGGGVVICGDVVISIAEVDLVQVSLRALVTSVRAEFESQHGVRARAALPEPQYAVRAELEPQSS